MDSEIALYSDLQKLILESLLDNFSNALKCCLVCKDWQLFCRPRIFKALEFASPQGKERFHGFVELLAAPVIPTFVPYVEHITLDDRLEPEDIEALDSGKLVKLYSLSVKYQTKELGPSSDYFKAISKEFPQIIHLDIAGAALIMRKTLTDFICSFHRLQKLALGDASCLGVLMNAHREIEERHWILPPLKSLCLSMNLGATFEETFLHWLANQLRSQKSLQTLRLLGVVTQPDRIQALMECVSPYLEELELDIRPFSLLNGLGNPGFSFPLLRTLKLGIPISSDQMASRESDFQDDDSNSTEDFFAIDLPVIPALSKELSQAKAPPLQELIFNFFVPSETGHFGSLCPLETLHRIRFTELDKTLSQLQHPCPNLHTVSFTCEEHVPTPRNLNCPQSLRNDNSACRIPLPKPYRDALCFEEMTSTFLEMAFPLTLAQGSVKLQVMDTSQDATPNALF